MAIFYTFLDTTGVNSIVLYKSKNGNSAIKRFEKHVKNMYAKFMWLPTHSAIHVMNKMRAMKKDFK